MYVVCVCVCVCVRERERERERMNQPVEIEIRRALVGCFCFVYTLGSLFSLMSIINLSISSIGSCLLSDIASFLRRSCCVTKSSL